MRKIRFSTYFIFTIILAALLLMPSVVLGQQDKPADDSSKPDDEPRTSTVKEIEEKYKLLEDEAVKARLDNISKRIIAILNEDEKKKKFYIKALDDDSINAFSLPDGHIYFFKGILDITKTDDQLAGVICHEMVHVIHKHAKMINKKTIPYVLGGMALALGTGEYALALAGDLLAASVGQSYGRKAEEDADMYGVELMTRAGFDPVGMLQFMSYMLEEEKRRPELFQNYFFVHPYAHERLETLKTRVRELGYEVPDSLYRSYLESGIEIRKENEIDLIDVKFGGEVLLTIAGTDSELLTARANNIIATFDGLLKSGARDFDFSIVSDNDQKWIQAKGRIVFEPEKLDIEKSGVDRDEFLDSILKKIKRLMWEERIKRGI